MYIRVKMGINDILYDDDLRDNITPERWIAARKKWNSFDGVDQDYMEAELEDESMDVDDLVDYILDEGSTGMAWHLEEVRMTDEEMYG